MSDPDLKDRWPNVSEIMEQKRLSVAKFLLAATTAVSVTVSAAVVFTQFNENETDAARGEIVASAYQNALFANPGATVSLQIGEDEASVTVNNQTQASKDSDCIMGFGNEDKQTSDALSVIQEVSRETIEQLLPVFDNSAGIEEAVSAGISDGALLLLQKMELSDFEGFIAVIDNTDVDPVSVTIDEASDYADIANDLYDRFCLP